MRYNVLYLIFSFGLLTSSCQTGKQLAKSSFYDYDPTAPLHSTRYPIGDHGDIYHAVEFNSTNNERVTGILSYPEQVGPPVPVIILVHGLGDHKERDYVQAGEEYLRTAGYAVLRIDLYNHGARKFEDFDFGLQGETKYRSRELITQSVFDLRRTIDFIESRPELDHHRIGYYGISLGGLIGTVFSGVDQRVKAPVITLAGGRLNLMFGAKALSKSTKNYLGVIDPIHFVQSISPRPLLMINAENDEVIPPASSRFLYNKAKEPKKIIWYPSKHRNLPLEKAFAAGIAWYQKHL